MPQKEQLIAWLRDAYALEVSVANVLQQHAKDADDVPALREGLERHLSETRGHADRVRACLDSLGSSPSTAKSTAASLLGLMQGMSTGVYRDALVKNVITDYATEHFEMACYSALASAAEDCGFPDIAESCREIFGEEAEMADWLEEQVPEIARMHIQQSAAAG